MSTLAAVDFQSGLKWLVSERKGSYTERSVWSGHPCVFKSVWLLRISLGTLYLDSSASMLNNLNCPLEYYEMCECG